MELTNFIKFLKKEYFYAFAISFFIFSMATLTKNSLGADERSYLELGSIFLSTGVYDSFKLHPLLPILMGFLDLFFISNLLMISFVYCFFGASLATISCMILKELKPNSIEHLKFNIIFFSLLPGLLILGLYSIRGIVFATFMYAGILFLIKFFNNKKNSYFIYSGILFAFSYLTSLEGLVSTFSVLIILLFLSFTSKINKICFFYFIMAFLIVISPWQLFLYKNELFLSTVINSGWNSSVWVDGPVKYIVNGLIFSDEYSFVKNLFKPLATNIVLYSESIGSVRLFPFFLIPFLGLSFLNRKIDKKEIFCLIPFTGSLAYLAFYVETRYLISLVPILGIYCLLGISNLSEKRSKREIAFVYVVIMLFLALGDLGYSLFGHSTYN